MALEVDLRIKIIEGENGEKTLEPSIQIPDSIRKLRIIQGTIIGVLHFFAYLSVFKALIGVNTLGFSLSVLFAFGSGYLGAQLFDSNLIFKFISPDILKILTTQDIPPLQSLAWMYQMMKQIKPTINGFILVGLSDIGLMFLQLFSVQTVPYGLFLIFLVKSYYFIKLCNKRNEKLMELKKLVKSNRKRPQV